jgi:hypothetical protein
MAKSMKDLKARAKEFSILLPFMEGKDKGELDRIIDINVTIIDYVFLKYTNDDGEEKDYVCFVTKEDPQHFYFGGQVLTDNMHELDAEGYGEAIRKEGLPVQFSKKKSKNKREYTTVNFYPEA